MFWEVLSLREYNKTDEYIQDVCNQIRTKRAHKAIAKEISDHIEDQKNSFILQGQDEKTAINNAIREMGDPVIIGEQFDKIHRPKPEKSIIAVVILSIFIQLISVNLYKMINFELNEYLLSIAIGIIAMLGIYFVDYSRIVRYSTFIYIILSVSDIFFKKISIRLIGASLSYYICLMMIIAFSGVVINFKNKGYKGYAACILLMMFGMINIVRMGNIVALVIFCAGTGALLLTACIKNVFKAGRKVTIALLIGGAALFFIVILFIFFAIHGEGDYLYERFAVAINPYRDPNGGGYLKILIRELLSESNFIGEAMMPERYSAHSLDNIMPSRGDFQLTYFIAKFGYIVGIAVIFITTFLILRMFISTFKQKNQQGMFISLGCSIVILIQSVFYITANLGHMIIGTISLPLLSYGKTAFIVNMIIIGLMLCTYRNDDVLELK